MNKKIKWIVLAILSFMIFAATMSYADDAAWSMIISLISFVLFMLSMQKFFLSFYSKSESN
ncbi:hypothetical protein LMF32_04535 [Desemzia sp. C1]|uniref:hypothetical protein n=1 Tax=Desemzia TaxID=82800 RepID=UPI0016611B89|nr:MULTISPECIES: hypothetical protein [Desemzia]MCI3028370.1 hypothetical protein [Desemzia sp. C1]